MGNGVLHPHKKFAQVEETLMVSIEDLSGAEVKVGLNTNG